MPNIHAHYDRLTNSVRRVVDEAFKAMSQTIRDAGLDTRNDDDAERLVDAISRFVIVSNPDVEVLPSQRDEFTPESADAFIDANTIDDDVAGARADRIGRALDVARARGDSA